MSGTSAWAHIPNAQHIDFVLSRTKEFAAWDAARDAAWDAARDAALGAAWDAAWGAARDAAWGAARDAAWDAARDAAWDAARDAAWGAARDAALGAALGAVAALVTRDDCSHWIYRKPDELKAYFRLSSDYVAPLILPFAILNEAHEHAMKDVA